MRSDDNAANRGRRSTSLVPDPPARDGRGPAALGLTGLAMMAIALAALLLAGCAAGPDRPGPAAVGGRGREGAEAGGEGIGEGSGEGWRVEPVALLLGDLDADRDRVVTRAELERAWRDLFRAADSDAGGGVTPLEYQGWSAAVLGTPDAAPGRLAFDPNGDGRIEPAEFEAGLVAAFARADSDGDGRVLRSELVSYIRAPRPAGRQGGGPGGAPGGMPSRRPSI